MSMHNSLNKAQRVALKRVFDRFPIYPSYNAGPTSNPTSPTSKPLTYMQFRRSVIISRDCAMVQWCGMWLGIEHDGYTHS